MRMNQTKASTSLSPSAHDCGNYCNRIDFCADIFSGPVRSPRLLESGSLVEAGSRSASLWEYCASVCSYWKPTGQSKSINHHLMIVVTLQSSLTGSDQNATEQVWTKQSLFFNLPNGQNRSQDSVVSTVTG
jgi:hypothetical protein